MQQEVLEKNPRVEMFIGFALGFDGEYGAPVWVQMPFKSSYTEDDAEMVFERIERTTENGDQVILGNDFLLDVTTMVRVLSDGSQ